MTMDKVNDGLGVRELSGTQGSHCKILSMGETEQGRSPCPGPTLGGGDRTLARNMEADQQMEQQRPESRPAGTSCG